MYKSQLNTSFSLVGNDQLVKVAAEIILLCGGSVSSLISSNPNVIAWAAERDINGYPLSSIPDKTRDSQSEDYVIVFNGSEEINDKVLAISRGIVMGLDYGSSADIRNSTSPLAAISNNDIESCVRWYRINKNDKHAELLKKSCFKLSESETSESFSIKWASALLADLPQFIRQLANECPKGIGGIDLTPIDISDIGVLARLGFLDWSDSADNAEREVRALNFGESENSAPAAKILLNDKVVIVGQAEVLTSSQGSEPGKILDFDEHSIIISTTNGLLRVTKLRDILGAKMLTSTLNINIGDAVGSFSQDVDNKLSNINKDIYEANQFFSQRIKELDPVEPPYFRQDLTEDASERSYTDVKVEVPSLFLQKINLTSDTSVSIGSAFCLLLARLGTKSKFDLALVGNTIDQASSLVPDLFGEFTIHHVKTDLALSCKSQLACITAELNADLKREPWLKDVVSQLPGLNVLSAIDGTLLPVALKIGNDGPVSGSAITLSVDESSATLHAKNGQMSKRSADKLAQQLTQIMSNIAAHPDVPVAELELLTNEEKQIIIESWNQTKVDYDNTQCIHHLFEEQVIAHPDATAVVFQNSSVTYKELNNLANNLAQILIDKGIKADELVGVNVERSIDLLVSTLGVMKAGAAYVPLDPAFPSDRISYMVNDAKMRFIITQTAIEKELPSSSAEAICVDSLNLNEQSLGNPKTNVQSSHLSYVIYTSGSTGNPKGVMVEHRNVVNFFLGMDERIEHENPGTWLAVTSLSFDISVLELFWTLTRGFKLVVYKEDRGAEKTIAAKKIQQQSMQFGLFMWGNDDAAGSSKYKLMLDGAKYFDDNNFDSIWTPERHFSAFGGPYPNPAVTSAAIAAITKNIKIRSGSIVSPLHHPIRIAEDWAVVDNLSDGRVGLSFAAGWQPNDFIIKPENHKNNKDIMLEQIETVKKLWRGEKVAFENPMGSMVDIVTLPRPVQKELPVWLTTAGNPESYRQAGAKGVNVLTHLLGQSVEEVTEKIRIYRQARLEAGFDPAEGHVTLMLHTFIGESDDEVREIVREPMKDYLRSAMKLVLDFAWSFPAFKRPGGADSNPADIDLKSLTEEESETILDFAFDRYYETSGLFGTTETCAKMIDRCKAAGVNEIACLLDFGVETEKVMRGLPLLKEVRDAANVHSSAAYDAEEEMDFSLPAQLAQHDVTHFQCTPSMARMLCFDNEARTQLAKLKHMMVGGEAFPISLANDLKSILTGRLTNMYGPTETTIWSTTQDVDNADLIPIGRPIANTNIFILDQNYQPVPPGVPGDLFIGGDGVVRGYLERPELTAERFIKSPFDRQKRIYWTGDLAKYRDDGVIDFLGRVDHQVKIRGYRIELGEIEALLGKHDSVRDCILLLREDTLGDQRLVAYVVPSSIAPDISELKQHLRKQLPEYMVPNDVVVLDEMPLTPNGKVDRKKLPSPQSQSKTAVADYVEPEDELQKIIATIWQESLQIEKVGMNDNFFDLGGHSLLIVGVHQQLKSRVEKPISLTDLYRFPTIRSLTEFLNNDDANSSLKQSSDRAKRRRDSMGLRKRGRK
jgi:natural product biosynthesis luciferase-like monooxygenase protein